MKKSLEEKAALLPTCPGVYRFLDGKGRVLYVGKAVNLRARVRQYLAGQDERLMVPVLVAAADEVEVVATSTEKEALLLENALIKKHRPRFNVLLRDDKNFLHIRLNPQGLWPRLNLVRKIKADGARYFGPYASASQARQTLAFVQRVFALRTCSDKVLKSRKRPCLLHQMERCSAPCTGLTSTESYGEDIRGSMLFLSGQKRSLIVKLSQRMHQAAEREDFERAARFRDLIRSIEATIESQQVVDTRLADRDVWGLFVEGDKGTAAMIPIREGVMGEPFTTPMPVIVGDQANALSTLINASYSKDDFIPSEILIPLAPIDLEALGEVLGERRGRKVVLAVPQRGSKRHLVEMANKNAEIRFLQENDEEQRLQAALERLAERLGLTTPPKRIECFDNSSLQGEHAVSAMAVFIDGQPDRSEYRRYRIKSAMGGDDYACMEEIIGRRFRRVLDEGHGPDLLVVDGGKGQMGVARAVLDDLGIHDQPLVGIKKPRTERKKGDRRATDKLVVPGLKQALALDERDPALRLLQHIRDEAHRHAIRYHRQKRLRSTLQSLLEAIDGVGPVRRKALLRQLGSAEAVASASEAELCQVPGIGPNLAEVIHQALNPQ
ncbi:MAG: excinuclease ABC subunit UvrC [Proteobacteria bacterium]|nr:excinuclease ABC subunit UvrC [Pseudomonadota bacterium]